MTAALIRFLVEKGVALDVALAASEIADNERKEELAQLLSTRHPLDSRGDKQRAWDREYRKRKRAHPLDIHSTPLDIHSTPAVQQPVATSENLSSFSKDSKILTKNPLEDREALASSRPLDKTKRGTRLPADWMPADPDYATELLRDRAAIELEKFRNHWAAAAGSRGVKLDWQAAWRNWVIKASEFAPRSAKPLTYFQQQREEAKNALRQLDAYAQGRESGEDPAELFPADPSPRSGRLHGGNGPTVLRLSRFPDREGN